MKVGLILPGSLWFSPYVRIYTRILECFKVDYAIISWNREGDDIVEGFQYNVPCTKGHGSAGWREYRGYIRFVKTIIKEQDFDKIIIFGPQMTCLLSLFLLLHFRRRYMIDYRDLSIEQKPGFKQLYAVMLKFSCANVISSPGFKNCLPKRDYILSHNFNVDSVKDALKVQSIHQSFNVTNGINVLTIGAIRDLSANLEVVKSLANKEGVRVSFVGKGSTAETIADYCNKEKIDNVSFSGFYQKDEESGYIENATFLNIFYPRIITHDTALSNRFYNSLIYKKPMIVTKDTTQGDYVEKYGLGVALKDCSELYESLIKYIDTENYSDYCERCNQLLRSFLNDQKLFEETVCSFTQE